MLDLHVHLLPGVDDGPRSLADALALARALVTDGVQHVVVTPHIYPGVYDNSIETVEAVQRSFATALAQHGVPLRLSSGAEVRLCAEMLDWLAQGRLPFLGGQGSHQRTVLVELPDALIPVGTDRLLASLIERGVTPLLAHPERNRAIAEQTQRLQPLVSMGCKLQLTAASVLGEFGTRALEASRKLLDAGWVDVVASDAHNLSGRRPRLAAARQWLVEHYGREVAERLTEHNPALLCDLGELAMQGDHGLTLRDLPHAEQLAHSEAEVRRSSLLNSLIDLDLSGVGPQSQTTPARDATGAFAGGDTLPMAWDLTDLWFEEKAAAAAAAEGRGTAQRSAQTSTDPTQGGHGNTQPDFAEWTLPAELADTPVEAAHADPLTPADASTDAPAAATDQAAARARTPNPAAGVRVEPVWQPDETPVAPPEQEAGTVDQTDPPLRKPQGGPESLRVPAQGEDGQHPDQGDGQDAGEAPHAGDKLSAAQEAAQSWVNESPHQPRSEAGKGWSRWLPRWISGRNEGSATTEPAARTAAALFAELPVSADSAGEDTAGAAASEGSSPPEAVAPAVSTPMSTEPRQKTPGMPKGMSWRQLPDLPAPPRTQASGSAAKASPKAAANAKANTTAAPAAAAVAQLQPPVAPAVPHRDGGKVWPPVGVSGSQRARHSRPEPTATVRVEPASTGGAASPTPPGTPTDAAGNPAPGPRARLPVLKEVVGE